jgi:hypothetical protein
VAINPAAPVPQGTYATCRMCGDIVPPDAATCPICGTDRPIRRADEAGLTGWRKKRFRLIQVARVSVVLAVVVLLAGLMIQAALTPAPVAADPLTETSVLTAVPGGYEAISGDVTGADYIQGNYTVLTPPGADLTLSIYNQSAFAHYAAGQPAQAMQAQPSGDNERIVFSALYTDTYYFVFANNYPAGSGINVTFYVTTTYETNVVVG